MVDLGSFGSLAFIGVIVGFWNQIKGVLYRIASLVISRNIISSDLYEAISAYCYKEYKHLSLSDKKYGYHNWFNHSANKTEPMAYENKKNKNLIFVYKNVPFILSYVQKNNKDNNTSQKSLIFVKGTLDVKSLIVESIDNLSVAMKSNSAIKRFGISIQRGAGAISKRRIVSDRVGGDENRGPLVYSSQDADLIQYNDLILGLGSLLDKNIEDIKWKETNDIPPFDRFLFNDNIMEVVEDIKKWKDSKDWYNKKDIPWRFGILAHGTPGSGKSSLVKAIGQSLDIPIHIFDIASMSNDEFDESWSQSKSASPIIVLIEDIDNIFNKRQNILGELSGGLTFDHLINSISGVENSDGILLFITTNNLEAIDEAIGIPDKNNMSSRPGRIDRLVKLNGMSEDCRRKMASRILEDCKEHIESIIKQSDGYTPAQLQETCRGIALKEYWKKNGLRKDQETESLV